MSKRGAPVVITRKDKKLNKGTHLLAFALTGGTSGIVTAAKATTNANYNARTAQLVRQSEQAANTDADHARAVASGQAYMARNARLAAAQAAQAAQRERLTELRAELKACNSRAERKAVRAAHRQRYFPLP